MNKLAWNEYALRKAVERIKEECNIHGSSCEGCPLVDTKTDVCIFESDPCDIDQDKIYPDKEY